MILNLKMNSGARSQNGVLCCFTFFNSLLRIKFFNKLYPHILASEFCILNSHKIFHTAKHQVIIITIFEKPL